MMRRNAEPSSHMRINGSNAVGKRSCALFQAGVSHALNTTVASAMLFAKTGEALPATVIASAGALRLWAPADPAGSSK